MAAQVFRLFFIPAKSAQQLILTVLPFHSLYFPWVQSKSKCEFVTYFDPNSTFSFEAFYGYSTFLVHMLISCIFENEFENPQNRILWKICRNVYYYPTSPKINFCFIKIAHNFIYKDFAMLRIHRRRRPAAALPPPGGKNENEVKPDFLQNDNPVQNSAHAVLLSSSHFSLSQKSRTHSCPFKAHNLLLCEMVLMPNILRASTNSLSLFADLQSYSYGSQQITGLRTSNEAFFHWNPELLGSGRQIGQINFGSFWVFFGRTRNTYFGTVSPLSMFFHYSTIITTKNLAFMFISQIFILDWDLNLGRKALGNLAFVCP